MNQTQLNELADKIENFMQQQRKPISITGGHIKRSHISFNVELDDATSLQSIEQRTAQIARLLNVSAVRVRHNGSGIHLDIQRQDAQPIDLLDFMARIPDKKIPSFTSILGLADDGTPLLARWPSVDVGHARISGPRGCGKTSLLNVIALSLALAHKPRELQIITLARSNQRAFDGLNGLPHLQPENDPRAVLENLCQLAEKRLAENITAPRLLVLVDELADWHDDADQFCLQALRQLVTTAASAGIHIIAATQKNYLSDADFRLRIIADWLPGDFIASYHAEAMSFTAAYLSEDQVFGLTQRLVRGDSRSDIIASSRTRNTIDAKQVRHYTPRMEGTTLHLDWNDSLSGIKGL